jgi:hypothetical protein
MSLPRASRLLPIVAFLLLAVPALAHAQSYRTRLGFGGGANIPLASEGYYSDGGSLWEAHIGVGDDHNVVSIVVGYVSFGGHPFADRLASVTEFELRSDWCPASQARFAPVGQLGLGLYRVVDPQEGERRLGFRGGVGMRWAPEWHTAVALVASVATVVDRGSPPRAWMGVTLDLQRWME